MKAVIAVTALLILSTLGYFAVEHNMNSAKLANHRPTIFDQTDCEINTCKFQCKHGDRTCTAASISYATCILTDSKCQAYAEYHATADAQDFLPNSWYECQENCKPANMGEYANRYNCVVKCGN